MTSFSPWESNWGLVSADSCRKITFHQAAAHAETHKLVVVLTSPKCSIQFPQTSSLSLVSQSKRNPLLSVGDLLYHFSSFSLFFKHFLTVLGVPFSVEDSTSPLFPLSDRALRIHFVDSAVHAHTHTHRRFVPTSASFTIDYKKEPAAVSGRDPQSCKASRSQEGRKIGLVLREPLHQPVKLAETARGEVRANRRKQH